MKTICAWCNKPLGVVFVSINTKDSEVTHGMCSECFKEFCKKFNGDLSKLFTGKKEEK